MLKHEHQLSHQGPTKGTKEMVVIVLKRLITKPVVTFMIILMLFSLIRIPFTEAFFTAQDHSAKVILKVTKLGVADADANMLFEDPFIIERIAESVVSNDDTTAPMMMVAEKEQLVLISPEETEIWALIELQGSYDTGDIFVPSLQLHHNGQATKALRGALTEGNSLRVAFDRTVIQGWLNDVVGDGNISFAVTGEGYKGGLDHFMFTGDGVLLFEERLIEPIQPLKEDSPVATELLEEATTTEEQPVVTSLQIEGLNNVLIPTSLMDAALDSISCLYTYTAAVSDQGEQYMEHETVSWSLAEEIVGVTINESGEVTVTSEALPGSMVIVATSKTNPLVFSTLDVTLIMEEVQEQEPSEKQLSEEEEVIPETEPTIPEDEPTIIKDEEDAVIEEIDEETAE
ncbi:MAG: hypothetical protein NUK65_02295 [Firmicutes bacterium]|nr:hypothetical protein [Bacillota bacterium]